MCGRYAFYSPAEAVRQYFAVDCELDLQPRYNIAPTQDVPVIRRRDGGKELVLLHWGLVPFWAKEKSIGNRMINARAETVAEKPSFRNALKSRRCLVLANGFYEWQKTGTAKQPHYICMQDQRPMAFAGLWESWDKGGELLESCAIITTTANELIAPIHHRMPVILSKDRQTDWLSGVPLDAGQLGSMLLPSPAGEMVAWPVDRKVNSPANQGSELIEAEPGQRGEPQ